jgi:hypothetical protein
MPDGRIMGLDYLYRNVISHDALRDVLTLLEHDAATDSSDSLRALMRSQGQGRSILGLSGLGREIWSGVDARVYIREMRNGWDAPR